MIGRRWLSVGLSVLMTVVLFGVAVQAETTAPVEKAVPVEMGARPRVGGGFMLTIQGSRLGEIKGDRRDGAIMVQDFSHQVSTAREAGSGLATGRRQHAPLIIQKMVDRTSPQLAQALVANERLPTVQLAYVGLEGKPLYTITLTNAQITALEQQGGDAQIIEHVSFSYQKIEWTWTDGGIRAVDDLSQGQ